MATQKVICSYQEVVDLHTESDTTTVIGIHTPTGDFPRRMFRGFFDQYKKYKYLGCSIKLVPAARLPADPLQVSYGAGNPDDPYTIDPRDMMNPIMFHGCHGDDLGVILNQLYGNDEGISDSVTGLRFGSITLPDNTVFANDELERLYYKALTDNTWKKAHPQKGFRKAGLRPLVYQLGTNRQIMPGSLDTALGSDDDLVGFNDSDLLEAVGGDPTTKSNVMTQTTYAKGIVNNLQLFTPRLTRLGWMDTRNVLTVSEPVDIGDLDITDADDRKTLMANAAKAMVNYAELPKIYMGVVLLSPSYKTEMYYRCIISHSFAFAKFRGISFQPDVTGVPTYWNKNGDDLFGIDVGHFDEVDTDPREGE